MILFPFFPHFRDLGYSRDLALIARESREIKAKRENQLCCYHCQRRHDYKKPQNGFFCNIKRRESSKYTCCCLISLHHPVFLMVWQDLSLSKLIYQYVF